MYKCGQRTCQNYLTLFVLHSKKGSFSLIFFSTVQFLFSSNMQYTYVIFIPSSNKKEKSLCFASGVTFHARPSQRQSDAILFKASIAQKQYLLILVIVIAYSLLHSCQNCVFWPEDCFQMGKQMD